MNSETHIEPGPTGLDRSNWDPTPRRFEGQSGYDNTASLLTLFNLFLRFFKN